jgi:hypothetical protein
MARQRLIAALLITVSVVAGSASAVDRALTMAAYSADSAAYVSYAAGGADLGQTALADSSDACCCEARSCWFVGADYRVLRMHFSEAVAFATLTTSFTPQGPDLRVNATELDFDYQSSFAVFFGYHLNDYADLRFTYWYLDTDTGFSATAGPADIIVDPFGNLGPPGTTIDTFASVRLNVFDFEYVRWAENYGSQSSWSYSVGLRYADVNQFYESTITAGPALVSNGIFGVDFSGVGPYASFTGRAWAGSTWSAFAKVGGALLVGQYDISTDVVIPGFATAGQTADRIRTVPILESELGVSWEPTNRFRLSAGWLVQAWMNLGVSGGTFDGENLAALGLPPIDTVFGGADDSDIMSFDGLFIRAEFNY